MKKAIVLSILGLAVSGFAAFGQGEIIFNNYLSPSYEPVYYNPNQAFAPAGLAGANVNNASVELQVYWMLGDNSSMSVSSFLAAATPNSNGSTFITTGANTAGSYKGSPAPTGAIGGPGGYVTGNTIALPTWTSGGVTFLITAWDSTGGATYANSALTGNSGVFYDNGSDIVSVGTPDNYLDNPAIMMSTAVPEPTTLAFAGMGLLSLFALARRRKAA